MDDTLFIEIQRLCQLAHQRGLREISIARPGFSAAITTVQVGMAPSTYIPMPVTGASVPMPVTAAVPAAEPAGYVIASPLIGLFYRSSSPDAPSFVEIGDTVEAGQTIGIVEAMKVFNEITTDHAGTVIAIPAENGALVQVDQPLVIIDPLA